MNDAVRFNDLTSPLSFLRTRRSGRPREMVAPGPTPAELDTILALAARVPDHGKLAPWRFVVIGNREKFADLLLDAFRAERPGSAAQELEPVRQFAHFAPTLVVVLSAPDRTSKIPVWEQELSAGAVCMNLLNAAHASGYTAGWITGWASYSSIVTDALGEPGERIAGFVFMGTPGRPLEERPRPDPGRIVRHWG